MTKPQTAWACRWLTLLAVACAALTLGASEAIPPADSQADDPRPLRQVNQSGAPSGSSEHHVWQDRFSLPLPDGDPHYERFLAVYNTSGGQAWLKAVFQRARPYAAYILDRIEYYGVPEELFFLPFIESEFHPKAVSRSGAVGLWQFMLNSIGGYDMKIDEWRDDRRDFMKATDGALRKLLWNYGHFKDWILAIAAYNCGVGALDRAIQRAGGVRDFWALKNLGVLPAETAAYIPKFLAVAKVGMQAGRNGLNPDWDRPIIWDSLPLDSPVDIGMLAAAIGLSPEVLKTGNPELLYNITPPGGNYRLKLPATHSAAARLALASADNLIKVYVHQVKSGDTVSAIARHYEVSLDMIVKMNAGLRPDHIRIGQKLIIPALKEKVPYAGVHTIDTQHNFEGSYLVQAGDTLWSISRRFNVPVELLAEKNKLAVSSILREGMSLNVPIINQ